MMFGQSLNDVFVIFWNKYDIIMKSFATLTMKSKQVWMKSKPCGFDEIKSVYLSAAGDFIHDSGFIPSKTDLDEKNTNLLSRLVFFSGAVEQT